MPSLDEIPRTTKDDLRGNESDHPPFGTHRSVGVEHAARVGVTTGTTGKPWMIFYSRDDVERMLEMQYQHTWRTGMRTGDHFAHSWPGGLYPSAVLGGRHLLQLGILEIPCGPPFTIDQAADHVALWNTLGIDALMCTASQLQIYEQAAEKNGVDLAAVLEGCVLVFVEASCQFEGPRQRFEQAYGVRLHNLSGAAEIPGFVTSDCRFHTGLHAPSSNYVVQVCDPVTGREVPAGQRGSLVMSTWGLDAFYLRYDLEDIVVASAEPCPCGQTGPRYTLIGRGADQAIVAGKVILPLDVQLALDDVGGPEFVLTAGHHDALELRIETDGDGNELGDRMAGHVAAGHVQATADLRVLSSDPVDTLGVADEHQVRFGRRDARCVDDLRVCLDQPRVGAEQLVDRPVAGEHAPKRSEGVDAAEHPTTDGVGRPLRVGAGCQRRHLAHHRR